MIVVEPLGGLGNQLFVYGLGLAVSRKLGVPLVAGLGRIEGDKKRKFELPSFNNSLADIPVDVPIPSGPAYHLLHRAFGLRREPSGQFRNFYYEREPGFDARFLEVPDGSRLRGFFQSYRYLESVADDLRDEIWDLREPSDWFKEQTNRLKSMGSWVAVHVRLGDYKELPGMRVAENYYERALRLLASLGAANKIVVFSDEIALAQEMAVWRSHKDVVFIGDDPQSKPIETMLLMALASDHVIANSTFSWWSAWMGKKEGQRVVCPRPWGNTTYETRDFLPADWITVGRETG
jgi:hypothetical protein